MGILSNIKDWFTMETVHWSGGKLPPPPMKETETNEIWMKLSVSQNGNNVSIKVHGLETVNVCLASFLTKGVSYAQEKYNEYKQSPKSAAEYEVSESLMAAFKEFAHNEARNEGKRRQEQTCKGTSKKGGNV